MLDLLVFVVAAFFGALGVALFTGRGDLAVRDCAVARAVLVFFFTVVFRVVTVLSPELLLSGCLIQDAEHLPCRPAREVRQIRG